MEKMLYSKELEMASKISCGKKKEIEEARRELVERAKKCDAIWVVLDDDPTGIQTVHDIAVYTDWEEETLKKAFDTEDKMFYILTNSRGVTADCTKRLHHELMQNLLSAAASAGKKFFVISRSDSTLRGHFPLETDIIREYMKKGLGRTMDGLIFAPFFYAGGRITCNNIHYVKYGDELIPAAETEFAKDETFGYGNSELGKYIEEKTKRKWESGQIISIPLKMLREGNVALVEELLNSAKDGVPIIVNALEPIDLEIFCAALYRSMERGKRFVYRTAADFVKAVGAIPDKNLLTKKDLDLKDGRGGIIMIGSHTDKTTRQLNRLKGVKNLEFVEYDSDKVLVDGLEEETQRVSKIAGNLIERGITPVIYTKRKVLTVQGDSREKALLRSARISDSFTGIVSHLKIMPSFIIGKGGITSSDIGTRALGVKRAVAIGQIQPGVPVWRTDEISRFPEIPYIIFPGNVGDDETLLKIVQILDGKEEKQ